MCVPAGKTIPLVPFEVNLSKGWKRRMGASVFDGLSPSITTGMKIQE
jgi:hypothetical protein